MACTTANMPGTSALCLIKQALISASDFLPGSMERLSLSFWFSRQPIACTQISLVELSRSAWHIPSYNADRWHKTMTRSAPPLERHNRNGLSSIGILTRVEYLRRLERHSNDHARLLSSCYCSTSKTKPLRHHLAYSLRRFYTTHSSTITKGPSLGRPLHPCRS